MNFDLHSCAVLLASDSVFGKVIPCVTLPCRCTVLVGGADAREMIRDLESGVCMLLYVVQGAVETKAQSKRRQGYQLYSSLHFVPSFTPRVRLLLKEQIEGIQKRDQACLKPATFQRNTHMA